MIKRVALVGAAFAGAIVTAGALNAAELATVSIAAVPVTREV